MACQRLLLLARPTAPVETEYVQCRKIPRNSRRVDSTPVATDSFTGAAKTFLCLTTITQMEGTWTDDRDEGIITWATQKQVYEAYVEWNK